MAVILVILQVVTLALLFGILIALHEIRDACVTLTAKPMVDPYLHMFKVPPDAGTFSKEAKPHG